MLQYRPQVPPEIWRKSGECFFRTAKELLTGLNEGVDAFVHFLSDLGQPLELCGSRDLATRPCQYLCLLHKQRPLFKNLPPSVSTRILLHIVTAPLPTDWCHPELLVQLASDSSTLGNYFLCDVPSFLLSMFTVFQMLV